MNDWLILADTSIWVDHFRTSNPAMIDLLNDGMIVTHPFILGELALGSLANRALLLRRLDQLVQVDVAHDFEVRQLIEDAELHSKGVGWVDVHLLASMRIHSSLHLWTRDKRLARAAEQIGLSLHTGGMPN